MPSSNDSASSRPLSVLGVSLPIGEMIPFAGDGAVAGVVTVTDHEERVVMEGLGDAVLVQVVCEVIVEAGANISIHRLQFDENERQPIDKAHQIGAPIVVRHPCAP